MVLFNNETNQQRQTQTHSGLTKGISSGSIYKIKSLTNKNAEVLMNENAVEGHTSNLGSSLNFLVEKITLSTES